MENKTTKEKIYQAALELLDNMENIDELTTRQIAKKANVNLALVNYYYQSKENLLSQIAQLKMAEIISRILEQSSNDESAVAKLKRLLTATADFSFKHNEIFKVAVANELKQGCKNSCELVMPMLKDIFRDKKELDLRIIALQLILPFHSIVLYPELYGQYLNTDFFDERKRTNTIEHMTDSLIGSFHKGG